MLGGFGHGIPRQVSITLIGINLRHQNHRVTYDDPDQRQYPKDRHKAHRRTRWDQRQHHANQAQRRNAGDQEHLLHTVQLNHQERRHQEDHQRHDTGNRSLSLATLFDGTARSNLVARR